MAKWILLIFVTLFVGLAQADYWIEPTLGYHMGSYDFSASSTGKISGVGLGGRGGMSITMFFFGLDFMYCSYSLTPDQAGDTGATGTGTSVGAIGGISIPILPLRGWLAYYPLNSLTVKKNSLETVASGSALKIGAGYTVIPMVSVNLEYYMHTYTTSKTGNVETTKDTKANTFFIAVGVPLSI